MVRLTIQPIQKLLAISLGVLFVFNSIQVAALAAQEIKDTKHSVNAKLQTEVWGTKATEGQIFVATLDNDVQYDKWILPTGTIFRGQVSKVRHSRHLGRPGYVVLNVEEVELPSGTVFALDPKKYKPRSAKLHERNSLTATQTAMQQAPSSAVGLAVTLPLSLTGAVSGVTTIPIGIGIRMLAGTAGGVFGKKYKNEPPMTKAALGTWDGTGLPRLAGFLGKYPEPAYKAGDSVKLHMNPDGLKDLFLVTESDKSKMSLAKPVMPQGEVVVPEKTTPAEGDVPNLVKQPSPTEQQTATFP